MDTALSTEYRFDAPEVQRDARGAVVRWTIRGTLELDLPVGHAVISVPQLHERGEARRCEIHLIDGHLPLSTLELLDAEFFTLSILRPPSERTPSHHRHQKYAEPRRSWPLARRKSTTSRSGSMG